MQFEAKITPQCVLTTFGVAVLVALVFTSSFMNDALAGETEIWSGSFVVERRVIDRTGVFWGGHINGMFSYGGVDYTVERVDTSPGLGTWVIISPPFPPKADLRGQFSLSLDPGGERDFGNSSPSGNRNTWGGLTDWDNGERVGVTIKGPAQLRTAEQLEETEVWSGNLGVGRQSSSYGYHISFRFPGNRTDRLGSLDSAQFEYQGVTYTIRGLIYQRSFGGVEDGPSKFTATIHPRLPEGGGLHLRIGNSRYYFSATDRRYTPPRGGGEVQYTWYRTLGWNEGDAVEVTAARNLPDGTLRLGGLPTGGARLLEMFDDENGDGVGQWKWICDDGFGDDEARVACQQLGAIGGIAWNIPACYFEFHESGTAGCPAFPELYGNEHALHLMRLVQTPCALDEVDCDGTESRLTDCDHAGRGVHDCSVREAIGVLCIHN